jgi:DNA-binding HxlR family transcriptional regulator
MKMEDVFEIAIIKILLYLFETNNARYSELLDEAIQSRSTLALALRDLQDEQLIERSVLASRPVQTRYTLTSEGNKVAEHLSTLKLILKEVKK